MNIRYQEGKLVLDLHELLESIPAQDKPEFLESISCDSDVIKHVVAQVLDKWTENSYSGSSYCTAQSDTTQAYCLPLDWAWREVAKRSGETAKREIERLEDAVKFHEQNYHRVLNELIEERNKSRTY